MSIEKMREEFEAWHKKEVASFIAAGEVHAARHMQAFKETMLAVWEASRAALVIELPPKPLVPDDPEEAIDDSHMDAYHSAVGMRHACLKFIEAAGVKVKP
jgi:hypothetical protein